MKRLRGIKLDHGTSEPLYRQLAERIGEKIRREELPPRYRLPPTREMAETLSVHRNTVVRAFEELVSLGLVTSEVGRGTFVTGIAEKTRILKPVNGLIGPLPWDALVSRSAGAESLGRLHRASLAGQVDSPINMARMEPSIDLFPVEWLQHCIHHVLRTHRGRTLGYAPREGVEALRQRIVDDLARKGIPARIEDVLITTGSQQGLDLAARTLLDPGDVILLQASSYTGAICIVSACGARSIGVPSDEEGPLLSFLERINQQRVKGFYLMPNVCNPTGVCISEERREALLRWSHRQGVPLLEDDYAADLELDNEEPPSSLRALDGEVIYIATFSKKLIPALRVGFIVCPPALRQRMLPLKHAMDLGTSSLLQYALAEFLERGYMRAHLENLLAAYRRRRDSLEESLRQHLPEEIRWRHASRGLLLWLSLPPGLSPDVVFEEARRKGVLVSPSTLNETGGPALQGGLRLIFTYESPERLAEGGRRLGQVLKILLAGESRKHLSLSGV